jgi:hypothetical protein
MFLVLLRPTESSKFVEDISQTSTFLPQFSLKWEVAQDMGGIWRGVYMIKCVCRPHSYSVVLCRDPR